MGGSRGTADWRAGWLAGLFVCVVSQVDTITLGCRDGSEQFVSIKIYPNAKEDPKIKVRSHHHHSCLVHPGPSGPTCLSEEL